MKLYKTGKLENEEHRIQVVSSGARGEA